jgi:hypothetical protein
MHQHAGPGHEFHIIVDSSVANPPDVTPSAELVSHGLTTHVTSYGNALSRAIEMGFEQGKLHFPPYLQIPPGQEHEAIQSLVNNFNFAQPLSEHAHVLRGATYDFNIDGLQRLIENALQGSANGYVDLDHLASTINNADSFLTQIFPQMLAQEAAEIGSQAALQGAAETIGHSIAVGAGAAIAGESVDKAPEGEAIKFEGVKSPDKQQPVTENREQQPQGEEAAKTDTEDSDAEAASAENQAPPERQSHEPAAESGKTINWAELSKDPADLKKASSEILTPLQSEGLEGLSPTQRKNLESLALFMEHQPKMADYNFYLNVKYNDEVARIIDASSVMGGYLKLQKIKDREHKTIIIDLSDPKQTAGLSTSIEVKAKPPKKDKK